MIIAIERSNMTCVFAYSYLSIANPTQALREMTWLG